MTPSVGRVEVRRSRNQNAASMRLIGIDLDDKTQNGLEPGKTRVFELEPDKHVFQTYLDGTWSRPLTVEVTPRP